MPRRGTDIHGLQGVRGLDPHIATAAPTGLFEGEVVSIAASHLDAKMVGRRAVQVAARFPLWYEPQIGDRVLIAELQGDERMRVVITPMSTKTGGKPKIKSG
jgi:hypothetical protein